MHVVSDAFKLVSRKWKAKPSRIELQNGVAIESGGFTMSPGIARL